MTALRSTLTPRRARLAWLFMGAVIGAFTVLLLTGGSSRNHRSGVPARQERTVRAFSGVELAGSNVVSIRVGGRRSVIVHADKSLLSRVTTTVRSGRLVIDTDGNTSSNVPMWVEVRTPALDTLVLSGSGVVRAEGTARRIGVMLSGSGVAELGGLAARDARAVIKGSGRIDVTASNRLDASIPGTGVISYGGDPAHVATNVSGTGAITRR
jgi:hypothetical protein